MCLFEYEWVPVGYVTSQVEYVTSKSYSATVPCSSHHSSWSPVRAEVDSPTHNTKFTVARAQQKAEERPKRTPKAAASVSTAQRPAPKRRKATSSASLKAKSNAVVASRKPAAKKKGQNTAKTLTKTNAASSAPAARDGTVLEKGERCNANEKVYVIKCGKMRSGILYFFVRPKVDVGDDPHGTDDIQRSFLVLRPLPDGKDDLKVAATSSKCRILVVPKKTMPNAKKHDRFL